MHHAGVRLLHAHGGGAGQPIERIEASLSLGTAGARPVVTARFRLAGDIAKLAIPPEGPGGRADGLWRHTCFEFFLRRRGAAGYAEVNVAPSAEWAAYAFRGYRAGMQPIEALVPQVEVSLSPGLLAVTVVCPFEPLAGAAPAACEAALAAVIEARDGSLSYWALVHPDPRRPDFHHPESFVHEVRH